VLDDVPVADAPALPPGDEPLVLVGLSSSYMEQTDLLRRIATALAELPLRAVITTGPAIDPAQVPAAPNVRVVRVAAHRDLVPRCALVITHAGHGTLVKSLAAGVPVLCLPLGRDQPDNAARAARHGVATVLPPKSSGTEIAAAVRRMLDDPAYRTAAAAMGERIRAEVDGSVLIPELEALARRERVSGRGGPGS